MTHTPTPWNQKLWFVETGDGLQKVAICNFKGKTPDSLDECRANAAHIVKCVNMHDALIGHIKNLLSIAHATDQKSLAMIDAANRVAYEEE